MPGNVLSFHARSLESREKRIASTGIIPEAFIAGITDEIKIVIPAITTIIRIISGET